MLIIKSYFWMFWFLPEPFEECIMERQIELSSFKRFSFPIFLSVERTKQTVFFILHTPYFKNLLKSFWVVGGRF